MAPRSRGQACYRQIGPGWKGVQTLLLKRIIRCKRMFPQLVVQAKFGVHPFRLEVIFRLVSFLHRVRSFRDSTIGRERYPYLALCSSKALALDPPSGRARGWFSKASRLLQWMTISPERLPSFNFSLDTLHHLLPTKQVLNHAIREDIYRLYIQVTWTLPPTSLVLKMFFYLEQFLELVDGIVVRPPYTHRHWMHSLRIPLGQL